VFDLLGSSKEKKSKGKVTSTVKRIPDAALSSLLLPFCSRQVWEAPKLNFCLRFCFSYLRDVQTSPFPSSQAVFLPAMPAYRAMAG